MGTGVSRHAAMRKQVPTSTNRHHTRREGTDLCMSWCVSIVVGREMGQPSLPLPFWAKGPMQSAWRRAESGYTLNKLDHPPSCSVAQRPLGLGDKTGWGFGEAQCRRGCSFAGG